MKVGEDEVAAIQEASRLINEQVSSFRSVYKTQDDLNIALMCCLKIASDHVRQQNHEDDIVNEASEKIDQIQTRLAGVLNES